VVLVKDGDEEEDEGEDEGEQEALDFEMLVSDEEGSAEDDALPPNPNMPWPGEPGFEEPWGLYGEGDGEGDEGERDDGEGDEWGLEDDDPALSLTSPLISPRSQKWRRRIRVSLSDEEGSDEKV
jgi:hypothetical protein